MNKIRFYFYRSTLFIAALFCFALTAYGDYFNPNYDRSKDFLKVQKILQEGNDTIRYVGFYVVELNFAFWADSAYVDNCYFFDSKCKHLDSLVRRGDSKTLYKINKISEHLWELNIIEDVNAPFFQDMRIVSDTISKVMDDSILITFETPNMIYPVRYIIQTTSGELAEANYIDSKYVIRSKGESIDIAKIFVLPEIVESYVPDLSHPLNNIPLSYDLNQEIKENVCIIIPNADTEKLLKIKNDKIILFFENNSDMISDIFPYPLHPHFPIKNQY